VKSRQDAESETVRERTWNWFISDLRTRLKPASAIVLIMTRWHESDLGGLLEKQQPGLWTILKLPAIAEENDPLGRQIGEWLWSDDAYDYASELKALCSEFETNGATREWAALYQQRPRPTEGALFKTGLIIAIDAIPSGATFIRAWDLAATAQVGTRDPDWTVGLKLARLPDGRWIVADVARDRLDPSGVEKMILATASQDGPTVKISLPQDPGQAGKSQSRNLAGKLAGYDVHVSREDGDKAVRATAVAAQCGVGNLLVLKAPWNAVFLDELSGFPSASKDDQVDALSRAFNVLNSGPPKPKIVMPFVAGVQLVCTGNPS
jgi:predicted phage terminase large subunit-like protein